MKLLMIAVYYKENEERTKTLQKEFSLNHVGYFQRGSLKSSLNSAAKAAVQNTARDAKQSINLDEKVYFPIEIDQLVLLGIVHVYVRSDGLAATVISDHEYPQEVANNLLSKVMDDFAAIHPATSWPDLPKGSGNMISLNATLRKYQDPDADPRVRLQKDVDETKEVLVETVKKVVERQENADELLEKAKKLETNTGRLFHTTERAKRKGCFSGLFSTVMPSFSFNKRN